jgi:hypothetical protein
MRLGDFGFGRDSGMSAIFRVPIAEVYSQTIWQTV